METQTNFSNYGIDFNWSLYNKSQTREKILFLHLLKELCDLIPDQKHDKGRKPEDTGNQIFCMCAKTYLNTSSRRLISELELCRRNQYIDKVPHFNSVLNYFNNPYLRDVLKELIELSSLPLLNIEKKFAVDSTGFSMRILHERWSFSRQAHSKHHLYRKAHICYGVLTNIATSCIVTKGSANDAPYLEPLVDNTAKYFKIEEVTADKAYSSRKNLNVIYNHGAMPFIPFRSNATSNKRGSMIWYNMYQFFKHNQEEFMKRYHLRSNSETGFWMIKQRFGDIIKTKTDQSQENEILCKVLCHNICVLIQEMFLMDVQIDFRNIVKKFGLLVVQ